MKLKALHLCTLLISTVFAVQLLGDQPDETLPFFRPDSIFDAHGIDNVNVFSGDPGVVIPLGPEYLLGPSSRWQLKAFNTSKFWHFSQSCLNDSTSRYAYVSGEPTVGVGWTLRPGYVVRSDLASGSFWYYWAPDGSAHQFPAVSTAVTALDGSRLRLTLTGGTTTNPTSFKIEYPDGSIHLLSQQFCRQGAGTPPSCSQTSGTRLDFTTLDYGETEHVRIGLKEVDDAFGNKILEIGYDASHPAEFTSIKLAGAAFPTGTPTVTLAWIDFTVNSTSWRVLDTILFPSPGGTQLKAKFQYQEPFPMMHTGFIRNNFDTQTQEVQCPGPSPADADVHELASITISDYPTTASLTSFSYTFTCFQAPDASTGVQKQGTLNIVTLPSRATITYDYSTAGSLKQLVAGSCEPYTCTNPPGGAPLEPLANNTGGYARFLDKTPSVASRKEFDPFTNRSATTTYDRLAFFVYNAQTGFADPLTFVRRVIVKRPGNDIAPGASTFATHYFFHAAFVDDTNPEDESNGIELERRSFLDDDSQMNESPARDVISCYGTYSATSPGPPGCGFEDSAGTVKEAKLAVRIPPNGDISWYGLRPSSQDGGTCTGTNPACTSVFSDPSASNFNALANHYYDTNTFSTLPGGLNRTSETHWTAASPETDWILDLYNHQFTWDGGGAIPAGSNGSTVVRQYADFDSTSGFLKGSWTWDSVSSTAIDTCRYSGAAGIVASDFSKTSAAAGEPTADPCPGTLPSVGTDSDAFGKTHTWTHLLLTQSNWQNGGSTIGWNTIDTARDTNTGLITESRDPNYVANANLKTLYVYDRLGRIAQIDPPGPEWPTTFCYVPVLNATTPFVLVKKTTASPTLGPSGTACNRDEGAPGANSGTIEAYQYDGIGRLVREMRRMNKLFSQATYFARRETRYDSAGHRTFVSDWQACPHDGNGTYADTDIGACTLPATVDPLAAPAASTQSLNFDLLGRAQEIIGPNHSSDVLVDRTDDRLSPPIAFSDSKEKITTSCVNGTWSAGACSGGTSSVTLIEKDALGRVTKVTEPDPSSGSPSTDTTSYSYNVLDKVTQVTQGSQSRTFQYNAFGFLKSETTPENGASGNATTSYTLYGSLGNLRTKTDGDAPATQYNYTYEAAGRLTLLTTGTSPTTSYLVNCYDGTGICGDTTVSNFAGGSYPKGRLTRRLGWNRVPYAAAPVYDDFTYSDGTGTSATPRLSSQKTSIGAKAGDTSISGFASPATQSWTYNSLGLVATQVHPRWSGSSTTLTVKDNDYHSGWLVNVKGTPQTGTDQQLVSSNYLPAGLLSDYTTPGSGNSVQTIITPDSLVPSRPGQIKTNMGLSTLFNTGTYAYDGAGNVQTMGGDSFRYDMRSRLTSALYAGQSTTCTDGVAMSQCFTYDRYGNLTSKAGINPATLTTAVGTNHLSSGGYDGRGNLASSALSGDSLSYDLLNRQVENINSVQGTDFIYLYDGAGERVGKYPAGAAMIRREIAKELIEGRGDNLPTCTTAPFGDVPTSDNDCKYIKKMNDAGITSGCGGGNYCPDVSLNRASAAVFYVKAKYCPLNGSSGSCTVTLPACQGIFADVTCTGPYASYAQSIEKLYTDGVTTGCGTDGQGHLIFCPDVTLSDWQAIAWITRSYWPTYYPIPRATILTYRDEKARIATEATQNGSTGSASALPITTRDNAFLGNLLISSAVWNGTTAGWQFYASDHLGTPRLVTDVTGSLIQTRKFWPYGDDGPTTGSDAGQRLKFAAMERDTETNHYYDHARVHDFNVGRASSIDINGGDIGNPQSLNGYSYSLANPIKVLDPDGKVPALAAGIALGAGLIEGGFRAANFALSRSNATSGDYLREFGIGFVAGVGDTLVGFAVAVGTKNPYIVGAAIGEADALLNQAGEVVTRQRASLDPLDVALKTGTGAFFGKTAEFLVPKLPGRVPRYFGARSFRDLLIRRNINRELRLGLADAFVGATASNAVDMLRDTAGSENVFGEGFTSFMSFLVDFNRQAAEQVPEGTVSTDSCFSAAPPGSPGNSCPR